MQVRLNNNFTAWVITGFLVVAGFVFRVRGLELNHSFWVDEASSATFARAIIENGEPVLSSGYKAGDYLLHFYLMAVSFKFFGLNEFAARIPSVVFGCLAILATYLVGSKLFDKKTGVVAAFLATFSVLQIVYSRQARAYQEAQFFYLMAVYYFVCFIDRLELKMKLSVKDAFFLLLFLSCAALTHKFALLFFPEALLYLVVFKRKLARKLLMKVGKLGRLIFTACALLFAMISLRYLNLGKALLETTSASWVAKYGFSQQEYLQVMLRHLRYYHSFLWRQYPHIVFLSLMGVAVAIKNNKKLMWLLLTIISLHIVFVITRVWPQFVRYVYLIFPLLLVLSSYFIVWLSETLFAGKKRFSLILLALISVFIVVNGNKFSFLPKNYYSLNMDMSEVPEPNYKEAYALIKDKIGKYNAILIDNRTDAAQWYLGEDKPDYYLTGKNEMEPMWILGKGITKDPVSGAVYLYDLDAFREIVRGNKAGFIVFETRALEYVGVENNIIDYIRKELRHEKTINNIPGNELSIWPIEIYSWGTD